MKKVPPTPKRHHTPTPPGTVLPEHERGALKLYAVFTSLGVAILYDVAKVGSYFVTSYASVLCGASLDR
jgi:hypothetical protein